MTVDDDGMTMDDDDITFEMELEASPLALVLIVVGGTLVALALVGLIGLALWAA